MTPAELITQVTAIVPVAAAADAEAARGQAVVVLDRAHLAGALRALRDHPALRFEMLADVTAVDYLGRTPRFEVVYQLNALRAGHRLRIRVPVPEDDAVVPSAVPLWKSALWAEREVWDMFGIRFAGHPDLRRILMYDAFEGHPLRKDYPLERRQPLVAERDPIAQPWSPGRGGA
jgi:NADH-quinone oxidoreductase subunit C